MKRKSWWASLGFVALAVMSVAGCASYRPVPLAPVQSEKEYRMRTLLDQKLRQFMKSNLGSALREWPPSKWNLPLLTLAAFYYHPDLDVARSRIGVAEAGIKTAGGRPNPAGRVTPGYTDSRSSPWLYGVLFGVPIETAGKRGHRIAQAQALTDAARLQLEEAAWQVRSSVRAALAEHLIAQRKLELLCTEQAVRAEAVTILEKRLAVGEVSRPDVDAARIGFSHSALAIKSAEGRVSESLATLAMSLGVPLPALDSLLFAWPALEMPPTELLP